MSAPNAELAYRVLDLANANPQHFDMGTWGWGEDGRPVTFADLTDDRCGTVACLAGWTAAIAGYAVDSDATVYDPKGQRIERKVDDLAADILGLTANERDTLFYCAGDQVEDRIAEIFGPRPEPTA